MSLPVAACVFARGDGHECFLTVSLVLYFNRACFSPPTMPRPVVAHANPDPHPSSHHQVKKAREAGTVDPLTLKDKDTGLPFKVRAFMRLDRSGKVSTLHRRVGGYGI